jgi:hypothetical protein
MTRFCKIPAFILLAVGITPLLARAQTSTTQPSPGITFERDIRTIPPVRFYIVYIDLTNPRIHLKVSRGGGWQKLPPPWEATLTPVTQLADRDGLAIAVNGNLFQCKDIQTIFGIRFPYFFGNWSRCCGWAMSDGVLFSSSPINSDWPSLLVTDKRKVSIGRLDRIPPDARQIVSGVWQIIDNGRITVAAAPPNSKEIAPHTAVGLDRDAKTLMFFVVDGRRPDYSVGMDWHHIAHEMSIRGAFNALLLDGGGSSTLVMRNNLGKADVVNLPSDGHDLPVSLSIQRCVADALGVVIDDAATRHDAADQLPNRE